MPFYFVMPTKKPIQKYRLLKNLYFILRNHLQDSSHFEYLG